jgi:hypothetical protein
MTMFPLYQQQRREIARLPGGMFVVGVERDG